MKKGKITFDIFYNEDNSIDIRPTIKGELTIGVSIAAIVMLIRGIKVRISLPRIVAMIVKEYIGGNK